MEGQESVSRTQQAVPRLLSSCFFLLASTIGVLGTPMHPANAISGGGKDYAEAKISGKDFSGGDYSSKDFSGVRESEKAPGSCRPQCVPPPL